MRVRKLRARLNSYSDSKKLRSSIFNFPVPFGGPTGFTTGLIVVVAVVGGMRMTGFIPRLSGCEGGGGGAKSKDMGELIDRTGVEELGGGEIVDGRRGGERLAERSGCEERGMESGGSIVDFGTEEKKSSRLSTSACSCTTVLASRGCGAVSGGEKVGTFVAGGGIVRLISFGRCVATIESMREGDAILVACTSSPNGSKISTAFPFSFVLG